MSDLGPIPKTSYYAYVNILKSEKYLKFKTLLVPSISNKVYQIQISLYTEEHKHILFPFSIKILTGDNWRIIRVSKCEAQAKKKSKLCIIKNNNS